jgi:heme-degrading monooxygenase HmoA
MIAVIFEVWPVAGRKEDYLELAASLRPDLERIDGFLSVERFQSLSDPRKLLALSLWRDEEAVKRWRNEQRHRVSQAAARAGIFADYRLRIASVTRDYGMRGRTEAPEDSLTFHDAREPALGGAT